MLIAALSGACGSSGGSSSATDGGFFINGGYDESSTALVDGDWHWNVLDPPRAGDEVYAIAALAANDVWFGGTRLRHFDGNAVSEVQAPAGAFAARDLPPYIDQFAVVGANDVWACGSRLLHWDGASWSDRTLPHPTVQGLTVLRCHVGASAHKVLVQESFFGGQDAGVLDGAGVLFFGDGTTMEPIQVSGVVGDPPTPPPCGMGCPLGYTCMSGFTSGCVFDANTFNAVWFAALLITADDQPGLLGVGTLAKDPSAGWQLHHGLGLGDTLAPVSAPAASGRIWARAQPFNFTDGLTIAAADPPGDFKHVGSAPQAVFSMDPNTSYSDGAYTFGAVAPTSDGALYLLGGNDRLGWFTFFLRWNGTGTYPADRLYGWQPFAVGTAGDEVFVGATAGALLHGAKR